MTPKLLLRTAAIVCAMLLGMTLPAQAQFKMLNASSYVGEICSPFAKPNPNLIYSSRTTPQLNQMAKNATAKAEGDLCSVSVIMEYDATQFSPVYGGGYLFDANSDTETNIRNNGEDVLGGQVPQGTYDIVTIFTHIDTGDQYYVIHEQLEITDDITLTVNPIQATNHITTKCYGPDGELLKLPVGHYDENGLVIIDEESNIWDFAIHNSLLVKGKYFYNLVSFLSSFYGPQRQDNQEGKRDVYVNDVSDRFIFQQAKIAHTTDNSKSYCCYFSTTDVKTDIVLENDPNDYVSQVYNYKYTPHGLQQTGYGFVTSFETGKFGTSAGELLLGKPGEVYTHEVWANVPYKDPYDSETNFYVQTSFVDYAGVKTIEVGEWSWEEPEVKGWTVGPSLRVNDGLKEFSNLGHTVYNEMSWHFSYYTDFYNVIDDDGNFIGQPLFPAPKAFTYPAECALDMINDNCPINAVYLKQYISNNQLYLDLGDNFVGRYGETRHCNEGTTHSLKFNGSEVDLESFLPESLGTYEYTANNPNIGVDGMMGHNTTTIFFDQLQGDMTSPSIEMLHFRNGDGGVTDRFPTACDGTIEFYAGDFNFQYYPELWTGMFDCQPVEVTVEYAPYGTEDWNELAVEEVPELYQMPGWGYFYRGSLEGVTGQAEKGWFDLRFRLQDEAGNWMDQVVSPAFRIDNLAYSSVATITPNKAGDNTIYNLAGQRMRGDLNSLPRGIYIVNGKKIIK